MKYLSLTLPGYTVSPPAGVPTGGLELGGDGQKLIQLGVNLLFAVGIVLTIVFIIIAGIQWITSAGDEEKLKKAKARLTYSIIGLLVIAGSFFIISVVITLLGGRPSFFFPGY
jgi:amino acid transporter